MEVGYHASHEHFAPQELKRLTPLAEGAGFAHAVYSDPFHPWGHQQGNSAFTWAWLGAVLEAATLSLGTVTPAMGYRYHPALIAQAAGTLLQMYPERFAWLAIGTGEALNEHIVGRSWPSKADRDTMLQAAAEIIRALWAGKTVSRTAPIAVDRARLYRRPPVAPDLFCAALTPATAREHASWSDGLLTVNQPPDRLGENVQAYRAGGGDGKLYLQVHLSWAETDAQAAEHALDCWRYNLVSPALASQLPMPEDFEAATRTVGVADLNGRVFCSADLNRHVEWLSQFAALGFNGLYLHFVGPNQQACIKAFARSVLPPLRRKIE